MIMIYNISCMNKRAMDFDILYNRYRKKHMIKKGLNAVFNLFIGLFGLSAVLYSVFVFGSNIFDRLRYMTFQGTLFTTTIAFIFVIVSTFETVRDTEIVSRFVYFLKLSSAVTELIFFLL